MPVKKLKAKSVLKSKGLKEIKVALWEKKQYLCEIGQPLGMRYAFLSSKDDGYRQCHVWIKCRDFLHDAVRSQVTGKMEEIFGFTHDPKNNPPIDLKTMRILLKRGDPASETEAAKGTQKMMRSALDIMHCIEKDAGIRPLSKLYNAAGNKNIYIFEGAVDWIESTFMLSLYTFIIRLGGKNIEFKDKKDLDDKLEKLHVSPKGPTDHDTRYLKSVQPFINKIVENRKKLKYVKKNGDLLFKSENVSMFHNYTGIVALCKQALGQNGKNDKLVDLEALTKYIKDKEDEHDRPKQMKTVAVKKSGGIT